MLKQKTNQILPATTEKIKRTREQHHVLSAYNFYFPITVETISQWGNGEM